MSILLITHDLGVMAETCDRVAVMYAGKIVEQAPMREVLLNPEAPLTVGLLDSLPVQVAVGEALRNGDSGQAPDVIRPFS